MGKREFNMSEVGEAGNLAYLTEPGFYKGTINEVKEFEGKDGKDDVLYVYMTVEAGKQGVITVRDRKSLGLKSLPYLKAFAASVNPRPKGWSDSDLSGKSWAPDFEKDLPNKTVFFQYSPPEFGVDGKPVDGSFANFNYMRKEKWEAQKKLAAQVLREAEEAAKAEGGASGGSGGGSMDFLNE